MATPAVSPCLSVRKKRTSKFGRPRALSLRVEVVLDLEPELARERLGPGPDEQVVLGEFGYRPGDERRGADALERRDATRPAPGSVHAAGIELDDTVRVGESAVAGPHLGWIVLGNVHARDEGSRARHRPDGNGLRGDGAHRLRRPVRRRRRTRDVRARVSAGGGPYDSARRQ